MADRRTHGAKMDQIGARRGTGKGHRWAANSVFCLGKRLLTVADPSGNVAGRPIEYCVSSDRGVLWCEGYDRFRAFWGISGVSPEWLKARPISAFGRQPCMAESDDDLPDGRHQRKKPTSVRGLYRVSHIRSSTARHERGCAACPRHEQGKATLRRLAAVKTR
jgi:hypothetical protein